VIEGNHYPSYSSKGNWNTIPACEARDLSELSLPILIEPSVGVANPANTCTPMRVVVQPLLHEKILAIALLL
jgi:hypothetical protein